MGRVHPFLGYVKVNLFIPPWTIDHALPGVTGMAKTKKKKEPVGGTKRELVIMARPAITVDDIRRDERKKNLLLLLYALEGQGGIYERSLNYLLYWLKTEKGVDFGYNFYLVGGVPTSKEVREDITALLYTGLAETDPRTKKLRITSNGKEFLASQGIDKQRLEEYKQLVEEYRPNISAIDAQIELTTVFSRPGAPRRRRF